MLYYAWLAVLEWPIILLKYTGSSLDKKGFIFVGTSMLETIVIRFDDLMDANPDTLRLSRLVDSLSLSSIESYRSTKVCFLV